MLDRLDRREVHHNSVLDYFFKLTPQLCRSGSFHSIRPQKANRKGWLLLDRVPAFVLRLQLVNEALCRIKGFSAAVSRFFKDLSLAALLC